VIEKQEAFARWLVERMGPDWSNYIGYVRPHASAWGLPNLADEGCQWLVLKWVVAEWRKQGHLVQLRFDFDDGCEIASVDLQGKCFTDAESKDLCWAGDTFLEAVEAAARALPEVTNVNT